LNVAAYAAAIIFDERRLSASLFFMRYRLAALRVLRAILPLFTIFVRAT